MQERMTIRYEVVKRIFAIFCILVIVIPIICHFENLATDNNDERDIECNNQTEIRILDYKGTIVPSASGGTWIPFYPLGPGTHSIIDPKSSSTTSLLIDTAFSGVYNISVELEPGKFYNFLQMPGTGSLGEIGKPTVPTLTRYFIVPDNVDIELDIEYGEASILDGFFLAPAQEPIPNLKDYDPPPFTLDNATYMTDAFYPADVVTAEGLSRTQPMVLRGYRFIPVTFYPVQFNPVTHQIRAYSKIELRIRYSEPAQIKAIPFRLCSDAFFKMYDALFPNFKFIAEHDECPRNAEYLIITNDTFYNAILPLADWKTQKGIKATVVKTSEINPAGPTAEEISDYIKNAYDTWALAPSYVLLVGDVEHLPTHYDLTHPYAPHGGHHVATDLLFGTVDGNDVFPDVFVGRLPVDTYIECVNLTYKLINYERYPELGVPNFYDQTTFAGEFQDNNADGYEDRRFIRTLEDIRSFLIGLGYSGDRIYHHDNPAGANPTNYNLGNYGTGDPIPADLQFPTFLWNGDTSHVIGNISMGRFLVMHRDHGSSQNYWSHFSNSFPSTYDGWTSPSFDTTDVSLLTNYLLFPVVFSMECMGGWFDGETDQLDDPALTNNFESLCEELLVPSTTGAIATIGASRVSYSGVNDDLAQGFIDAIWPDYDQDFDSGGLYSFGQIMTYGKAFMATRDFWGANLYVDLTYELFNLFGDPELELWTKSPDTLYVDHPTHIGSLGPQSFVVQVDDGINPVDHARVCLWKDGDIFEVAYSDTLGYVYFDITPFSSGSMYITATKHNYIPYDGMISITSSGATILVTPEQGSAGISVTISGIDFDGSETVDIYFGGPSIDTSVPSSGGAFTIPSFVVTSGNDGPLNIYAEGQSSGRSAIALFRRLPTTPLPDPYLYSQWDSSTWFLNPAGGDPRWDSPTIELFDQSTMNSVASNDLEIGHTYVIRATIYNDGTVDAIDTSIDFEWAMWGAGQTVWHLIDTNTVTVPAGSSITSDSTWTPSVTGHTCLMITLTHPSDSNLENNKGQENTHVNPVSSPGETSFMIENPTGTVGTPFVNVRQVGDPNITIWENAINRTYPQVLGPGGNQTATLWFNAPETAAVGEDRVIVVDVYLYGELIGGIEVTVEKIEHTSTTQISSTTTSQSTTSTSTSVTTTSSTVITTTETTTSSTTTTITSGIDVTTLLMILAIGGGIVLVLIILVLIRRR